MPYFSSRPSSVHCLTTRATRSAQRSFPGIARHISLRRRFVAIDRDQGFQRMGAHFGSQPRPYHVVDPRVGPRQIVDRLQELLRVFYAPANEDVEIDVPLPAGEELGGPRVVNLHPPIDCQPRLIGHLEIQPGLVQGLYRAAELRDDDELGLVDEQQAAPGNRQDDDEQGKSKQFFHGVFLVYGVFVPLLSGLSLGASRTAGGRFAGESSPLRPKYNARRPPCAASTITFRLPARATSIVCK